MPKKLSVDNVSLAEAQELVRQLREERDRYRRLADLSNQALVECDAEYHIVAANHAYAARFGLKRDDVIGRNVRDIVGPEPYKYVKAAMETGQPQRFQVRANYNGMGERCVEVLYEIRRDQNNSIVAIVGCATDVTDQKNAELALRKSNSLLEGIINTVDALIFVKDRDGRYLLVNRWFEQAFEKSREFIVGKTDDDIVSPEQAEVYRKHDLRVFQKGEALRVEESGPVKGELRSYIVSKFPLRNASGEVEAVCGLATDITDFKNLQKTLQENEASLREEQERLLAALEAAGAGTFRWNIVTNELDWDESLDRLFGLQPGQSARSLDAFIQMVHPDDRTGVIDRCGRCAAKGADFEMEFRVLWPDGSEHWLYDRGKTFFDAQGKSSYMTGACVDVTERKQTEVRLKSIETRERAILEFLPVGVWFINKEKQIIYGNKVAQEIWGGAKYVKSDRIREYRGWWHKTGKPVEPHEWASELALKEKKPILNQLVDIETFDGAKKTMLNSAAPILLPDGKLDGVVVFNLDVTDQARMEVALRRANEDLEHRVAERTAKLQETIGDLEAFSYSISHDMRSPLRSMQGFADLLLREHASKLPDDAQDMLGRIKRAAHRLDLLILDVLSYGRIAKEQIGLTLLSLDSVVEELIANYPSFQQPLAVIIVKGPLGKASAHPAFVSQIFSNLFSNAVKFVAPGIQPRIHIRAEKEGEDVRIWVEDNGIGIEPQHADRVFQIFGRIHPAKKYEGTGIGLAVVKKAVERMGGKIGFTSTPGDGCKFWFTLKRANE